MVFLESISRLLLLAHAVAAIALVGAACHNALLALSHLNGRLVKPKRQRTYVAITFWLYAATFVLGLVIYPAFKVFVREAFLDAEVPLATGFFEVKEHWLGISLGLLAWYYPTSRSFDITVETTETPLYHWAGIGLAVVVVLSVIVGLVLVTIESI